MFTLSWACQSLSKMKHYATSGKLIQYSPPSINVNWWQNSCCFDFQTMAIEPQFHNWCIFVLLPVGTLFATLWVWHVQRRSCYAAEEVFISDDLSISFFVTSFSLRHFLVFFFFRSSSKSPYYSLSYNPAENCILLCQVAFPIIML